MNIKDIEASGVGEGQKFEGDKLDQIFAGQKKLMEKYRGISEDHFSKVFGGPVRISEEAWNGTEANLHTKEGNFLIKDMLDATIQELAEAVQVMKNWKTWKQTEVPSDAEHFKEELIDALHFFVEACILAGMTAEDIHSIYFKKNKVNQFRQDSKY